MGTRQPLNLQAVRLDEFTLRVPLPDGGAYLINIERFPGELAKELRDGRGHRVRRTRDGFAERIRIMRQDAGDLSGAAPAGGS